MTRPATPLGGDAEPDPPAGVRVVLDARPLQEPDRSPLTAAYLEGLLGAFDAEPLDGESFALLLRSDLDDPTTAFGHLDVVGRRLLPPTHLLRSAALAIDPLPAPVALIVPAAEFDERLQVALVGLHRIG